MRLKRTIFVNEMVSKVKVEIDSDFGVVATDGFDNRLNTVWTSFWFRFTQKQLFCNGGEREFLLQGT